MHSLTMLFLDYGHNYFIIALSFVVANAAGFTGLSLTKNISSRTIKQRKLSIALAALALGGGIWSMHFVAMLGLQLPIMFYYDAAITLGSALVAILIAAAALVLLHFRERTTVNLIAAGCLLGGGILAMHYIGMAGLQLCRAVYWPPGVVLSSIAAIALCILAIRVAYSTRTNRNILIGTLCFGAAVFALHFLAMAGTNFIAVEGTREFGPMISNESMAIGVIFSSFIILGAFLWVGATYLVPTPIVSEPDQREDAPPLARCTIPCEGDGVRVFLRPEDVALMRADGHYTQVYTDEARYFCVWPITEAGKRLHPAGFLKTHRSYLINPSKVARFERGKDKGHCTFVSDKLPPAPVSRSNVKKIEAILTEDYSAGRAL